MSDSTTRYRIEELQDHEGNVIYPQTDARGVWLPDGNTLFNFLNTRASDAEIEAALID